MRRLFVYSQNIVIPLVVCVVTAVLAFAPCRRAHALPGEVYLGALGGAGVPLGTFQTFFTPGWAAGIDVEYVTDMRYLALHLKSDVYSFGGGTFPNLFVPLYGTLALKTPWSWPLALALYGFGGGGIVWEFMTIDGERMQSYDPLITGGAGIELRVSLAGVELGPYLEAAYQFIFQTSQRAASYNGELMTIRTGVKLRLW
jgi:hypothetical protein